MKMCYETAQKLGNNLSRSSIEYAKKNGHIYAPITEKQANDVHFSSYDYGDGEATFTSKTKEDIAIWLELYKDIVVEV